MDRRKEKSWHILEFQERMIMVEEWWSFAQKGDSVWITHFKHRSLH